MCICARWKHTYIYAQRAHKYLYIYIHMLNTYTFIYERWEAQYSCYIRIHEKAHAHTHTWLVWCAKFRAPIHMSTWNIKTKFSKHAQRPILCAINGIKQRLRIMRMSIKCYCITQVGYISTRWLFRYMYMYTCIYIYCRRRISCFGNSLRSKAVKREGCGVVTKESLHADVELG